VKRSVEQNGKEIRFCLGGEDRRFGPAAFLTRRRRRRCCCCYSSSTSASAIRKKAVSSSFSPESLSPPPTGFTPTKKKDYKEIIKKNRIFMKEFSENGKKMI